MTAYIVNITKAGRHVALVSTLDADLIEQMEATLQPFGYSFDVIDASPNPTPKKNGKSGL